MSLKERIEYVVGVCSGEGFVSVDGVNEEGLWYLVHDKATGEVRNQYLAPYKENISQWQEERRSWKNIAHKVLEFANSVDAARFFEVPI